MNFEKLTLSLIFILIGLNAKGQSIKFILSKEAYKVNEEFLVMFESSIKIDSIGEFFNENLKVIKGPNKNEFISKKNGVEEYILKIDYIVNPFKAGSVEVKAPIFYHEGLPITLESKSINILKGDVSEEEVIENNFDKFKAAALKPNGTTRYVIFDTYGYIEVFKIMKWEFFKNLTEKEVAALKSFQ